MAGPFDPLKEPALVILRQTVVLPVVARHVIQAVTQGQPFLLRQLGQFFQDFSQAHAGILSLKSMLCHLDSHITLLPRHELIQIQHNPRRRRPGRQLLYRDRRFANLMSLRQRLRILAMLGIPRA